MEVPENGPPAVATRNINTSASRADVQISLTLHARQQMQDRDLIMGDLLHLLKQGFVYDEPVPASREGLFRYAVESTTPNSDGRAVRAITISNGDRELKIVTVMWRDER